METNKTNYLLVILIILLSVLLIGGWYKGDNRDTREMRESINKSEKRIDSLSNANNELNRRISIYSAQINDLNTKLNNNQNQLNKLRNDVQNQIKDVDTYSYDKLCKFFSDRYNQGNIRN